MTARWGELSAAEVTARIGGDLISGKAGTCFKGLSIDSREIASGDLFWVLRGENHDAHDFIRGALEQGACGVVLEDPSKAVVSKGREPAIIRVPDTLKALGDLAAWWRKEYDVPTVAVTGSIGKTTTKEMAAEILELGGPTLKNKGNFNNLIGLPLTLFSMGEHHRRAVLEMGMNRPGEIARLTDIADPDIGCIVNVARVHLEGLGSLEGVVKAKMELVERISPEARIILNGDDRVLMEAAAPFKRKILTYGLGEAHDIRAGKVRDLGLEGIAFELIAEGKTLPIRMKMPGIQNIPNALAASAIALCLNENPDHIVRGLENYAGIKGRFMPVPLPNGVTLVDDSYNSNPVSLRASIQALKALSGGRRRIIAGLGEMLELGAETGRAHEEAGAMVAGMGVSYLVVLGEHADKMVRGAREGGLPADRAVIAENHGHMAESIRNIMEEQDVILIKGSRGMTLEKVVQNLQESCH